MISTRNLAAFVRVKQPLVPLHRLAPRHSNEGRQDFMVVHARVSSLMAFSGYDTLQNYGIPSPSLPNHSRPNRGLPSHNLPEPWIQDVGLDIGTGAPKWSEWSNVQSKPVDIEKPMVLTPMAADLLHSGHINILNIAAQHGRVVVGLITDEGMRSYKRDPILPYAERERMLRCYRQVDDVIPFDGVNYSKYILQYQPKYFIHGDDWCDPSSPQFQSRLDAIELMRAWDGQVVEPPYTPGVSTTQIIKRCAAEVQQAQAKVETQAVEDTRVRGFEDVWHLVPNQIGYVRLMMGMAPVVLPLEYYCLSAGLYLSSHALDLVDGAIARKLNQTSEFGALLDLTVDNLTCAAFMLKLCSLPAAPAAFVVPCCAVLAVEAAQLSMAVNVAPSGRYWKDTDDGCTPWVLRKLWLKDNHHTNFGLFCVMAQQVAMASAWMWVFDPCSTWLGLLAAMSPFAAVKLWANSAVAYKLLRTWREVTK